ncbi:hypothetical protein Esti_002019 [Eimeria stiedai]
MCNTQQQQQQQQQQQDCLGSVLVAAMLCLLCHGSGDVSARIVFRSALMMARWCVCICSLGQQCLEAPVSPYPPQLLLPPLPLQPNHRGSLLLLLLTQQQVQQQQEHVARLHKASDLPRQTQLGMQTAAPRQGWPPPQGPGGFRASRGAPRGPSNPVEYLSSPPGRVLLQGPYSECLCSYCAAADEFVPGAFIPLSVSMIDIDSSSSSSRLKSSRKKAAAGDAGEIEALPYVFVFERTQRLLMLVAEQLAAAAAATPTTTAAAAAAAATGAAHATKDVKPRSEACKQEEGAPANDGGPSSNDQGPSNKSLTKCVPVQTVAEVSPPAVATAATAARDADSADETFSLKEGRASGVSSAAAPPVAAASVSSAAAREARVAAASPAGALSCMEGGSPETAAAAAAGLCSGLSLRLDTCCLLLDFLEGARLSVHLKAQLTGLRRWAAECSAFFVVLKPTQQQQQKLQL